MKASVPVSLVVAIILGVVAAAVSFYMINVSKEPAEHFPNETTFKTNYTIDSISISKEPGGYHYHMLLRGQVMTDNDTTVIPIIYYKYNYMRCHENNELHLKKGKKKDFVCTIDLDTDYSPVEKRCSGELNRHETIRCGNISFMIEDVIDLHAETSILKDIIFHPHGIQYMYLPYIQTLENTMKSLPKPWKANENLPQYAALIAIDDGASKNMKIIEYDKGCEQCNIKYRQYIPGPAAVASPVKHTLTGACNDRLMDEIIKNHKCENVALHPLHSCMFDISKETKNECRKGKNEVEIENSFYSIYIDVKSARYYHVPDVDKDYGGKRMAGFDSFNMETHGGQFKEEKAAVEIYYIKPGCTLLDTAQTSDQLYKAMDMCKNVEIVKHDRIWVDDVLSGGGGGGSGGFK